MSSGGEVVQRTRERIYFCIAMFYFSGPMPCYVLRYGERKSKLYILKASSIVLNLLYIKFSLSDELNNLVSYQPKT